MQNLCFNMNQKEKHSQNTSKKSIRKKMFEAAEKTRKVSLAQISLLRVYFNAKVVAAFFNKNVKLWGGFRQGNTHVVLNVQPISWFCFDSKKSRKSRFTEVACNERNKSNHGSLYQARIIL